MMEQDLITLSSEEESEDEYAEMDAVVLGPAKAK
jgi:hypothetical protein